MTLTQDERDAVIFFFQAVMLLVIMLIAYVGIKIYKEVADV